MAHVLARRQYFSKLGHRRLPDLNCDALCIAQGTDGAPLRARRIAHVIVEDLVPLREMEASHGINMVAIKSVGPTQRNQQPGLNSPRAGQLVPHACCTTL